MALSVRDLEAVAVVLRDGRDGHRRREERGHHGGRAR
jgi:hypothetical protein